MSMRRTIRSSPTVKRYSTDAANAVLAAAGYNFRRLLAWLALLWRVLITAMLADAAETDLAPTRSA